METQTPFTRIRKQVSDTRPREWKLCDQNASVMSEQEFMNELLDRCYKQASSVTNNLRTALQQKRLPISRANVFRLLSEPLVKDCYQRLRRRSISMSDMYSFLAVMLFSHITGFSFRKSVTILNHDRLNDALLSFISESIAHQTTNNDRPINNLTYQQQSTTINDSLHLQTLLTLDQSQDITDFLIHLQVPCIAFTPPHSQNHPFIPRSLLSQDYSDTDLIIEDAPLGICTMSAKAENISLPANQQLYAVAIRALGTTEQPITRFMYTLPSPLADIINVWLTIPYQSTFDEYLFTRCFQQGRIVSPRGNTFRDSLEKHLLASCNVITIAQRSADWFVLSQYRVTTADTLYMCSENILQSMGYQPRSTPLSLSSRINNLYNCWFKTTDIDMKSGDDNKNAVLEAIKQTSYIPALFKVGLLALKDKPWFASSPDAICVIDMNHVPGKYTSNTNLPCCVMVNTRISSSVRNVSNVTNMDDIIICEHNDPILRQSIPEEDVANIIHAMVTTRISSCLYIAANETRVLYVVLILFSDSLLDTAEDFIDTTIGEYVRWAYYDGITRIPDVFNDEQKRILESRLPFWRCVNEHVMNKCAYVPIQQFRHCSETLYLKTQSNEDDVRARERFMDDMNTGQEQKMIYDVFKSLAMNAFVGWRMLMKKDLLDSKEAFQSMEHYRGALEQVQTLPDFIHDLAVELLQKNKEPQQQEDANTTVVTQAELERLCGLAKARKRNRLHYFNDGDGLKLRVVVKNHPHCKGGSEIYCALCGQNRGNGFRGHRSGYKCGYCDVHLCIKVRGMISCWDAWHSESRLVPRVHAGRVKSGLREESVKRTRLSK